MTAKECIMTRRSVRKFNEQPVTAEELEQVVALAAYAPSWKNSQTARYIALTSAEDMNKLIEGGLSGIEHNQNIVKGAPAVVVLTTINERAGYNRDGSFCNSKGTHWQSFDAGVAAQTFCLAAHELGLGTVILGMFDEAKVIEMLEIPEGQSVSALIVIGHPAEEPVAPPRKATEVLLTIR